jgi:hypothetical protein
VEAVVNRIGLLNLTKSFARGVEKRDMETSLLLEKRYVVVEVVESQIGLSDTTKRFVVGVANLVQAEW